MMVAAAPASSDVPTLRGKHVALVPLDRMHADALRVAASDGELWSLRYTNVPGPNAGEVEAYVDAALAMHQQGDALPFAVLDAEGVVVGSTRFYGIHATAPRMLLGYTWYARSVQRSGLNTEAKLLLLGHAFETMRCECVALETSHENIRSQQAILRLGAKRDGILRADKRHRDGSLRDTHVFSILLGEWPQVKAGLLEKLLTHEAAEK